MKKLKSLLYGAVCIFVFSFLLGAGAAQAAFIGFGTTDVDHRSPLETDVAISDL